jgi:quercetin dioxygenase-like cupin family protein
MKVVTLKDIPSVPMEGAERIEGWTGPVSRSRQTIIQPGESANYNCSVVNFSQGCTTGWHSHTCDQVLIMTSGSGPEPAWAYGTLGIAASERYPKPRTSDLGALPR